jgi:hypothetical protein
MTRHYSIGFERPGEIAVVDLEPAGHYYGGEPYYGFHTSFPARGVQALGIAYPTKEAAWERGVEWARSYEAAAPMANMAEVIGVIETTGGYAPVVNSFHSNT